MKKFTIGLMVIIGFASTSFAQEGLFAGGHFAYNSTWLMNPQVFDEGPEMDVDVPFGYYWGFFVGYDFMDKLGASVEFNVNTMRQKYVGDIDFLVGDDHNSYIATTVLKTFDIPLLLKIGGDSYFEIGPVFQMVNKATYTATYDEVFTINPGWYNQMLIVNNDNFKTRSNENVKDDFAKNGIAIAFGFGSDMELVDDVLFLNIGVRFQYTLTDMEGVNGLGLNIDSNFVPEDNQDGDNEKNRFKTNPLIGGFKIGLKYKI
jgi:hypothetical protein